MESKTKQKILNFANTKEFNINDDGDNKLWAVNGSTVVHIEISKLNDGTEMVEFLSTVVIEPRIDEQLLRKLLALNANFNFGAFGMWDDGTIVFKYNILGGDHMDIDEFDTAFTMVAIIADEYDNKIISTHGGKTALDYHKEVSEKQENRKMLPW
jgi:hypothetical protein